MNSRWPEGTNTLSDTWTPTRTGWTDVGSPTVTARYCMVGKLCFFQVKVVPATSIALVLGTSYISIPITPNAGAIAGMAEMSNLTTLAPIGACVIDIANGRCYVPTLGVTANTVLIAGIYEG